MILAKRGIDSAGSNFLIWKFGNRSGYGPSWVITRVLSTVVFRIYRPPIIAAHFWSIEKAVSSLERCRLQEMFGEDLRPKWLLISLRNASPKLFNFCSPTPGMRRNSVEFVGYCLAISRSDTSEKMM